MGFLSKLWKGVKKTFKKIFKPIKKVFKTIGKFVNKLGIVGQIAMMFIPIPIKAKYFVAGYGALELINGIQQRPGDNVAHFAHLGGMLFGFLLIKYWQRNAKRKYF